MWGRAFAWLGASLLGTAFVYALFLLLRYDYDWANIRPYTPLFLKGWLTTLALSLLSLLTSVFLAILLTASQQSNFRPLRGMARLYVELIRGTPFLTQILIGFYILAPAVQMENRFWAGVLLLSIFASSYLSEIFRGGIESVAKSQREAARAVGFTQAQTYQYVIIPQAIRRVLPALAGQLASLIKDSSLLSVIGIGEFTKQAQDVNAISYSTYESYLPLAIGYLFLTLPLSWLARWLEKRYAYDS